MPKGPQGQKRPADQNQLAKRIVDIASGDAPDDKARPIKEEDGRRKGGEKGARNRAARLSPERRAEIARNAARSRWKGAAAPERTE